MTDEQIIEMAKKAWSDAGEGWAVDHWFDDRAKAFKVFAKLVAQHEREEIAQIFDVDPRLVDFARNDEGGCFICGFTPRVAAQLIRARGEA